MKNLTSPERAAEEGFTLQSEARSATHQLGDHASANRKYVNYDTGAESVFDKQSRLVTEAANMGTRNFRSAATAPVGHFLLDVLPWLVWGNSSDDPTNVFARSAVLVGGAAEEMAGGGGKATGAFVKKLVSTSGAK